MKKIGIVITDGVGYRNFVLSEFLGRTSSAFDEVVLFSGLPSHIYGALPSNCRLVELPEHKESPLTWCFRKAKETAHLAFHRKNNFGINDNYTANRATRNDARGLITRFLYSWTSHFNSTWWIKKYDFAQRLSFPAKSIRPLVEILKKERVSTIFFTHQRPPFIAPIACAAKKLGLSTGAFIFSWDNLASKGRMAAEFDYFLVWSDLMKRELLHFYDHVRNENVFVVGTPQFEPYVMDCYAMRREEFAKRFAVDPNKKTLFYSCGDISTSKNDEMYIEIIAEAILSSKLPDVNFIVRTSPAESHERFDTLARKYPSISWNFPDWVLARLGHQEEWSQRYPLPSDIAALRALLEHSDVNVNVLSTMTLDFILFDKPVICPVFGTGDNGLYNDRRFLSFRHLTYLVDSNAVDIVCDERELLDSIRRAFLAPLEKSEQRKALVALEIGGTLNGTSERMIEALQKKCNITH